MKFTLVQLMEANNMEKDAAYALVTFLRKQGVLDDIGSAPRKEGMKGRAEIVFGGDPKKVAKALTEIKFPKGE